MKRFMGILFVMLIVAVSVYSQSATTIGASYWRAKPDFEVGMFQDVEVSDGNMFGPYINFRSGKLVLGGSLYMGNFKMESSINDPYYYYNPYYYYYGYYYNNINLIPGDLTKVEVTLKRTDINVTVGYSLNNAVTVFGAMKNISEKLTDYKIGGHSIPDMDEIEYNGMLFGGGLSAVMVFPQSAFFLFGSAAYLAGNMTYKVGGEEFDLGDAEKQKLLSFTVGAGYRLTPQLNLLVGYRGDSMKSGDEEDDAEEKYSGITVSLGYTIR
ncbi:outer membrane beta-barrel protein [bacterium]|nr:outer membrane beta-barrel protein [bacterium]